MNVLVLGGTGAMGCHLVKLLSEANHIVTVTSRKFRPDFGNVRYVQGNAHSIEFLQELLGKGAGRDAIIDFMLYQTREFAERMPLLLNSTKQYVFLSSARVYAEAEGQITENSPRLLDVCQDEQYMETDEYALAKARQENLLFHSECNNYTIIRPYITFSENRLQLGVLEKEAWLYRVLNGRSIVFSEDIADRKTTLTYGYDVASGIVAIIGKEKAYGQAFHITSVETYTWREVFEMYLAVLEKQIGKQPKVIMTKESHRIVTPWKYPVMYDRYYDRSFCNDKINDLIDTSCFKDPIMALQECLEEFLKRPVFNEIHIKDQAQMDRIAGEHMGLLEIKNLKKYWKYICFRYFGKD